ncbi:NUMOD1 domain-containing DNA-binding protein [Flavobacterium sp.]|uniref:NUMOD1 domain-containing DNA-binding protein n=1 Tax=Flavobacterium sp. TaxID=239 RepID=UPI0037C05F15
MDYLRAYYNIIKKAGHAERLGYLELHHIVPRCIFGEKILNEGNLKDVNQNSNLVYLTAREHFVAHWLLHRAFPTNKKLGLAFWAMAGMFSPDQKRDYIPSSRAIAEARVAAANARKTPVIQYNLEGLFIREFNSLNSASKSAGIVPNAIGQNLNSYTKSAGGFQWRFKTKVFKNKIEPYVILNNGLPVGQYDLNGKLIKSFKSLLECERITGHSEGSIRAAMNRGAKIKKTSYFFIQFNKHQEIPVEIEPFVIPIHGFSIPVVQISADNKYFIKEFPSITHAAISLGKNTGHISSACLGKRDTAFGYIWKYRSDYHENLKTIDISLANKKLHSKPIAQYDLNGSYIRSFVSASEASRVMNDLQSNISSVAIGKRNYSGKYQYAYIENGNIPLKKPVKIADNVSKKVLQLIVSTDEVVAEFSSVAIAAKSVNGSQSNISACINGRKKTAYGFKWKFK